MRMGSDMRPAGIEEGVRLGFGEYHGQLVGGGWGVEILSPLDLYVSGINLGQDTGSCV